MISGPPFQAFGPAHLSVVALTIVLPFLLAAFVRRSHWCAAEKGIAFVLSGLLIGNYLSYLFFVRHFGLVTWQEALPMHLCDWATLVVIVALLSGRRSWFEVAYFWGIGGTLQAVLTPNLPFGFPDLRFISFFVAHSGIIVGIVFMMLVHKYRPVPRSVVRVFLWTELYFIVTYTVDLLTGVNYGFFLHKPQAFSLLSFLSDSHILYLLQMQLLALVFFCILYLPFAILDLFNRRNTAVITSS